MKTLMISVHPEWVEKILNGDKTFEVRPWIPKGELPLEVLIYITKGKPYLAEEKINHDDAWDDAWEVSQTFLGYSLFDTKYELDFRDEYYVKNCPPLNGKVVASFILNKTDQIFRELYTINFGKNTFEAGNLLYCTTKLRNDKLLKMSCISEDKMSKYLKNEFGYAWHIDDLEIFDRPKELGEFYHYKKKLIDCGMDCPPYVDEVKVPLTKAPQKMVWVEE